MANLKTKINDLDVIDFIEQIEDPVQKVDAYRLLNIFKRATGLDPIMFGSAIIGFGQYHYQYASGHQGDASITGFSPRKKKFSLYLYLEYKKDDALLAKLGKVTHGVACVYFVQLADIDEEILIQMIHRTFSFIEKTYGKESMTLQ